MSITAYVGATHVLFRNYLVYKRSWLVFLSGFIEPVLYLFSIGVGVGQLVTGFEIGGRLVSYTAFVAPAMLALSAFSGSLFDSTFNFFFKLKYEKVYDTIIVTPLSVFDIARGEIIWCVLRSGIYSAGFLAIMAAMGLVQSWWALLAWPATVLIGFAIASIGMALTTFMKSWQDFEFVTLAVTPMTLFSATFFPVTAYPEAVRWILEVTPLYRGVVLCRELTTGTPTLASLVSVVYLVGLGYLGVRIIGRRLERLLLH